MTVRINPDLSAETIDSMSLYDLFRAAEDLFANRFPRQAAQLLGRVVEAEPSNAAAWELLGRATFAAALLVPAENAFRRLLELEPASSWAHVALALTLDRQSRHGEGAVHHRLASVMAPDQERRPRLVVPD